MSTAFATPPPVETLVPATQRQAETLTLQASFPADWTLANLQEHLGGVPFERIRMVPPPGYATEEHVLCIQEQTGGLCELQDGILVEKAMGWYESFLAMIIGGELYKFVMERNLGKLLGADGTVRILPGVVKIPDVSFISWARWPKQPLPRRPIPALVPDLVVEVLSETNTKREMEQKLQRYFEAGVRLVWYVDPATRSADVFLSPGDVTHVDPTGELDGRDVLPGFRLSLREVFEIADRQPPA
jgi:Uma2 family endonuclease